MEWEIDRGGCFSHKETNSDKNGIIKQISTESMEYFVKTKRVMGLLEQQEDKMDEIEIIKERVFTEIAGKEISFICNTVASKVIQKLLYYITNEQLLTFFLTIGENILIISKNEFGSHIIQVLIDRCTPLLHQKPQNSNIPKLIEILQKLIDTCAELFNNLYGNFVMRSLICALSNIQMTDSFSSSEFNKKTDSRDEEKYFTVVVQKFEKDKTIAKMLRMLYTTFRKSTNSSDWFRDQNIGIILVHLLLGLNNYNEKLFNKAFNRTFKNILKFLSLDSSTWFSSINGNFTSIWILQVLCKYSNDEQLKIFYDALETNFDGFYKDKISINLIKTILNRTSDNEMAFKISTKIIDAVRKSNIKDKDLLILSFIVTHLSKLICLDSNILNKLFECFKNKNEDNLVKYIVTFGNQSTSIKNDVISSYGCSFISKIFASIDYPPLTEGLLSLDTNEVLTIASHPSGSRVIDAFVLSSYISDQNKKVFVENITNEMVCLLSKNKYGSFCLENIWKFFPKPRKAHLAQLLMDMPHFKFNHTGKMLSAKLNLLSYIDSTPRPYKRSRHVS